MQIINGDILEIKRGIIIHQVNALKICGGLAGALHRKFPKAFKPYFADQRSVWDRLGTCLIGRESDELLIAHVFGQHNPGPHTNLVAVSSALSHLKNVLKTIQHPLPIYAPFRIGCGLGGGDWSKYLPILEKHFPDIIIVKKFD